MKSQNYFADGHGILKRSHHDFAVRHGTFKKSDELKRDPTDERRTVRGVTY